MTQQSRNRDVEECVILPMRAAFPPPTHLRGSDHAQEASLNVYRRALAKFPRDVLERAWQEAAERQDYFMWPRCATILEACERIEKEAGVPVERVEWVEEATRLMDEYGTRYMKTSKEAARARAGGYEGHLRAYVTECAWVQGQLIAGRTDGLGYSSVLFAHAEDLDATRDEFFEAAAAQARKGVIKVTVPRGLIARWQTEAATARGR
jgi:hypothetical protein